MTNNPKIIERIKKQIKNTTKEQLQKAIRLTDEEYNEYNGKNKEIQLENNNICCIEEKYTIFNVHKKKTSHVLNIFRKNK